MFCPRCGKPVSDQSRFCTSCGNPLKVAPQPAAPKAQPPVAPAPQPAAPKVQPPVAPAPQPAAPKAQPPVAPAPQPAAPKAQPPVAPAPQPAAPKVQPPVAPAPQPAAPKVQPPVAPAPQPAAPKVQPPVTPTPQPAPVVRPVAPTPVAPSNVSTPAKKSRKGLVALLVILGVLLMAAVAVVFLLLPGSADASNEAPSTEVPQDQLVSVGDGVSMVVNELLITFRSNADRESIEELVKNNGGEILSKHETLNQYRVRFDVNNVSDLQQLNRQFLQESIVASVNYNLIYWNNSDDTSGNGEDIGYAPTEPVWTDPVMDDSWTEQAPDQELEFAEPTEAY